jgi:lysophospholipase L1-like esterase
VRADGLRSTRSLLPVAIVTALVTLLGAIPARAAHASTAPRTDPGAQYLSLGDSIAFGFQESILDRQMKTGNFNPNAYRHGFTDDLALRLRRLHHGLQKINLACPGETTDSFRNACGYPFGLHVDYTGSQLDAALRAIAAGHGAVGTITISLGANDLLGLIDSCGGDPDCITRELPQAMNHVRQNLLFIVRSLHAAAPDAVIVLLQYYNPFAPFDPSSTPYFLALDAAIGAVAAMTHSKVADAYTPFNLTQPQPQTLCHLTLFCRAEDVHPSDAGYRKIAKVMFDATGYPKHP